MKNIIYCLCFMLQVQGCFYVVKDTKPLLYLIPACSGMFCIKVSKYNPILPWGTKSTTLQYVFLPQSTWVQPFNLYCCLKAHEYNPSIYFFCLKTHEYNPSIYINCAFRHMNTTLQSIFFVLSHMKTNRTKLQIGEKWQLYIHVYKSMFISVE